MKIAITVKRQVSEKDRPYFQTFSYEGDGNLTVADWLMAQNHSPSVDEIGKEAGKIFWECGCLEKKCGACAMRINGRPALACSVYVKDIVKNKKILLEPLSKFPVIRDLIVDRESMFRMLRDMKIWLDEKDATDYDWDRELQYRAGQCLMCGCCLEICPNFCAGDRFGGAAAMVNAYKALEQNRNDPHRKEMLVEYRRKFYNGCGQSFSCQDVCPMELPLDEIQARTNAFLRK